MFFSRSRNSLTLEDIQSNECYEEPLYHFYQKVEDSKTRNKHKIDCVLTTSDIDDRKTGRQTDDIERISSFLDPNEVNETINLNNIENSEVENPQTSHIEGYKVPPAFLGYEKMERLDDPYVNTEAEDMKISEATCLHPSSYVNTQDTGMVTQELNKALKTAKSSQTPPQLDKAGSEMAVKKLNDDKESTKSRKQKGNQGGKMLKPVSDCVDGFKEEKIMTRGDRVITKGDSEMTSEDNILIREDGYNIPRPEGHYEEINDDSD